MNNNSSLSHRKEEPENGILYIVGTPIGNLNDISQRALNILKNVSLVACEDTRQTRKIMNKFNISKKSDKLWGNKFKIIVEYKEHTNNKNIENSLNLLKKFSQRWPKHEKPEEWFVKNKNTSTEKINYKYKK